MIQITNPSIFRSLPQSHPTQLTPTPAKTNITHRRHLASEIPNHKTQPYGLSPSSPPSRIRAGSTRNTDGLRSRPGVRSTRPNTQSANRTGTSPSRQQITPQCGETRHLGCESGKPRALESRAVRVAGLMEGLNSLRAYGRCFFGQEAMRGEGKQNFIWMRMRRLIADI